MIALNAATGKLLWKFDPGSHGWQPARGLAYWSDGKEKRILAGVMNSVYALDADTGKPISTFGENGRIDLRKDLGRDPETQSIALTSPGVVYKDLLIVGGRDPETLPAPPGRYSRLQRPQRQAGVVVPYHPASRASLDTTPGPRTPGNISARPTTGPGMTIDLKRGILYVPTGSAAMDFYGANRIGDDLFANCLIALKAETGETNLAFPGRAARHLGPRLPFTANSGHGAARRKRSGRRGPNQQAGLRLLFDRSNGQTLFPH